MTDTDAVLINTEDHSLIFCGSVSLKVRKGGKKKSIHADRGNTEKLQRWTHGTVQVLGERKQKWKIVK